MVQFFTTFLYQPLFNFLVFLYKYTPGHDFGVAVIALTVIIKLILYPLGNWAIKSQKSIAEIQPKVKEIQEKYKNDKERQTKEMLEIYKKYKVNPFSGLLPILIQLPILIALYQVFWQGLNPSQSNLLYTFNDIQEPIRPFFIGLIDLSKPNLMLAVLAGILQFFQTKMVAPKLKAAKSGNKDVSNIVQKEMQYLLPVFTVLILARIPSALGLYLAVTGLFSIIQQYFVMKNKKV